MCDRKKSITGWCICESICREVFSLITGKIHYNSSQPRCNCICLIMWVEDGTVIGSCYAHRLHIEMDDASPVPSQHPKNKPNTQTCTLQSCSFGVRARATRFWPSLVRAQLSVMSFKPRPNLLEEELLFLWLCDKCYLKWQKPSLKRNDLMCMSIFHPLTWKSGSMTYTAATH